MSNPNKPFRGRAIYQPGGAAGEYSQWACNLFNGCPNRCDYCYNRHSRTAKVLGADEVTMKNQLRPTLRTNFESVAEREIFMHSEEIIRDGGLFMSFVSDPLLPQTYRATRQIMRICNWAKVPLTILTKSAWWMSDEMCSASGHARLLGQSVREMLLHYNREISLGFTLTGMEYMERYCISNTQERIKAMKWAQEQGIYTWASIEPVIDYQRAIDVIIRSLPYCSEYRIGLASKLGIKYDKEAVLAFKHQVEELIGDKAKIIWKKSVIDKIK